MSLRQWMFSFLYKLAPLMLCCSFSVNAKPLQLLLLLSSDQAYYQQTADTLIESIDAKTQTVVRQQTVTEDSINLERHDDLIVSIGTRATKKILEVCSSTPVLSIFIPQSTFESIAASRRSCPEFRPISAIYLDQPFSRFLELALQLKPAAKTLGIVLGPASVNRIATIKQLAQNRGLSLGHAVISSRDNPIAILRPLMERSDIVLPLPDQGAINRAVAKWVLNLSFQNKTPVIGFSRAYAEAGAIASVFSSPQDIGHHAGQLISRWHNNGDPGIWSPQFPEDFTLKINAIVSRSLGISVEPTTTLKSRIQGLESKNEVSR